MDRIDKIYPQATAGKYRNIKNYFSYLILTLYYTASWIRWNRGRGLPNQAFLIDLPNRKAYIFSIQFWPEDIYYITAILIISALSLFFITSLFGRIWCGYGCPHTIFTDLFIKIEQYFQGDRNQRILLDKQNLTKIKFTKKILTHSCWFVLAFSFAFGWVCYFYDAHQLFEGLVTASLNSDGMLWLIGLTFSTYFFAGFAREKICTFICPYGRFQSAMLDNNSSIVAYNNLRGEPRGKDNQSFDLGDCIDCGKCVFVCPMGIDIRDGLQMECVGCGLCIDACNSVMEKVGKPMNLISYSSSNQLHSQALPFYNKSKFLTAKLSIFLFILIAMSSVLIYLLLNKEQVKINFSGSRTSQNTILSDGSKRYAYNLKIYNKGYYVKNLNLSLGNIDAASFRINEPNNIFTNSQTITINAEDEIQLEIFIKIPHNNIQEYNEFKFILEDTSNKKKFIKSSKLTLD